MIDKNHTQFSSLFSYNLNPLITMHWYNSGFLWLWKGRKYGKFHKTWVTCFDYLNKGQYALFTTQSEKAKAIMTWLRRVSRAWQSLQVFPRLAAVTFFPALGTSDMLSRVGTGYMFSRARRWFPAFPRLESVTCFFLEFWSFFWVFIVCCDWPDAITQLIYLIFGELFLGYFPLDLPL